MQGGPNTRSTEGAKTRFFVLSVLLVFHSPLYAAQAAKTVLDGVYSETQAARGHDFYTSVCSSCHGVALEGVSAPQLTGNRFIERWREGTLDPLYEFIRQRMPFGRPANAKPIPDNEYLDILTYILKMNDYRAGESDLSPGALSNVMLVGLNGPRPVPDGSHVTTIGCLSPAGDGLWVLSHATEPARAPADKVSTPAELKGLSARKLGNLTFRLADMEAVPDFSPSAHNGHKMQAKGFLVRQPNAERISLTAMEMLDPSCAE
jgi:mono/diheme cytochrome c family protein